MAREPRSLQDLIRSRQQSGFVGRHQQVIQYHENLGLPVDDERRRFLFNIHGDAGVGKTYLTKQLRQIAINYGCLTAYIDETVDDAASAMTAIAEEFSRSGVRLAEFEKRVTAYWERRHELEADPKAPEGVAAFLTQTAVTIGLAAARDVPIAGSLLAPVDAAAVADQINRARTYLARKFGDQADARLLLSPADELTPVFVSDMDRAAAGRPVALFIDTYERTGPLLDHWLRRLYNGQYGDLPETLITTISGQNPLDPDLWGDYLPVVADVPLEPFSEAEARQFLASKNIHDESTIQAILTLSGRLPMWLATLAESRLTSPSSPLITYVTSADRPETTTGAQVSIAVRLLALAEEMRGRLAESSQDLYVASLSVCDSLRSEGGSDVLERYLTLVAGPDGLTGVRTQGWIDSLRDQVRYTDGAAFSRLLPVLAEGAVLREQILDAILADPELAAATASYLRYRPGQDPKAAWGAAIEEWSRKRWWLVHGLGELDGLDLRESSLATAQEAVEDYKVRTPPYLHSGLAKITRALTALREFTRAASFEDKETALRTVVRCATALRTEIRNAPTALAVEAVAPVAQLLSRLAERESQALLEANPPRPRLQPALEQGTIAHDVLTIQVKVSNQEDSAPLESAVLSVEPNTSSLIPVVRPIALPGPVRAGTAHVVQIRMPLAHELPVSHVAVPITLSYRPRFGSARLLEKTVTFGLMPPGSFTEVQNPYLAGASGVPVTSGRMFFGRDEFIDQIRGRIRKAAGPGAGVAIFGQKRSGKSSIRVHLVDRLRKLDGFPVVDVGNIGDLTPTSDESDPKKLLAILMWRIIEGAEKERQSKIPFLPPNLRREELLASPDPVYDFARLFIDYRAAVPEIPPFVVCLDEFQYIEGWIRDGLVPPVLMQMFKALVERRLFHLVIVGQSDLARLVRNDPNVFGVFTTERVSYLTAPAARELIEQPIPMDGHSRYQERAVDRILELTGGNAFYIQRICSDLVDYMNDQGAPLVTEADIDLVSAAFLDRLTEADFDNLESHGQDGFTTAEYRAVLLAIARAFEHGQATPESIAEEYHGDRLPEILRELTAHEVIQRDGGAYRIVVGIYRDWLIKFMGPS